MPGTALWVPGLRLVSVCSGIGLAASAGEVWRGSGHCHSEWALAPLLCFRPGMTVSTELRPSALMSSFVSFLDPWAPFFLLTHLFGLEHHSCCVWASVPFKAELHSLFPMRFA